jgi:arsenate reductase
VERASSPDRLINFTFPWSRTMATEQRPLNVLFLCTGNSARSIIAEAALRQAGGVRFRSFSAGSHPAGQVNPFALEYLRASRLPTDDLRSKSWDEFARPDAPPLDFVFTVCDNAAGEVCPVWPGQPMTAHWGVPDPAAVEGSDADKRKAFSETGRVLMNRIRLFASLSLDKLDRLSLAKRLNDIGRTTSSDDATT